MIRRVRLPALLMSVSLFCLSSIAHAAESADDRLARIEEALTAQQARLEAQAQQLSDQAAEIAALKAERDGLLDNIRAGQRLPFVIGAAQVAAPAAPPAEPPVSGSVSGSASASGGERLYAQNDVQSDVREAGRPRPVGEAPTSAGQVQEVEALPERAGVLTPRGRFVVTPSFEFVRSSNNRLVFRGVEIVPGLQLGVIEADDADRNSLVATIATRYGVTNRLEVEARVPYTYRRDRITTLAQRDNTISRTFDLEGQDIGDIEVAARYQLNDLKPGRPIFVANTRVKSPTGRGPYEIDFDEFGAATRLATGSGFWAAEGGVSMLYPTDPAVIFAGLTYLHNFPRDVDRTIGDAVIERVEPGASIGANLGFGISLNPRFSISMGYSHNYIFPTKTRISGNWQESESLQVGSMLMGWSFRLTERLTLSNNFEFGVTSDAPDMRVVFSLPYRF